MTVREIWLPDARIGVSGVGYRPKGEFALLEERGRGDVDGHPPLTLPQPVEEPFANDGMRPRESGRRWI